MTPSVTDRVGHIDTAITSINDASKDQTRTSFTDNMMLRMAVERLLEIISEASRHLPDAIKLNAPDINWRRLADLGNWLRHAYHRTDAGLLWVVVKDDLPSLKAFVDKALQDAKRQL